MLKVLFTLCVCVSMNLLADDPAAALKRLMEGNNRYVHDKLLHPDRTYERRQELKSSQNPFAVVVGCSDSRVSPEIVFDQGIGDLFVVRLAGNVVGPLSQESVHFAANLGASVVLVLGHENCGAVNAVLLHKAQDFPHIAEHIEPAVAASKSIRGGSPLENAIKANVRMVVEDLKKSPPLVKFIADKKIEIVGGYYHLGSGEVELLK